VTAWCVLHPCGVVAAGRRNTNTGRLHSAGCDEDDEQSASEQNDRCSSQRTEGKQSFDRSLGEKRLPKDINGSIFSLPLLFVTQNSVSRFFRSAEGRRLKISATGATWTISGTP